LYKIDKYTIKHFRALVDVNAPDLTLTKYNLKINNVRITRLGEQLMITGHL